MDALSRGQLVWTGEHWINYLRQPGSDEDAGMLSLYRAHHTPAGRGHVAAVVVNGGDGFSALCTDNPGLASFISATMFVDGLFNGLSLPVVEASFLRDGDIGEEPVWTITTADHQVRASWRQIATPYVGPPTLNPTIVFTILFFAASGSLSLDGVPVPGQPYKRDVWRKNLGRPHSSCCFALAETMVTE